MDTASHENEEIAERKSQFKNFDDILVYVSEAKRYQWMLIFILLHFLIILASAYFAQFGLTLIPEEHWCKVPELEDKNLTDWQKIEFSVPPKILVEGEVESYVTFSRCKMYDRNYTDVLLTGKKPGADTPIRSCQYGWSFNRTSVPFLSIAAQQLEWVCDNEYLGTTTQSIYFLGSIMGALIFGHIGDHYGLLPALIACNTVALFASIATALSNNYWTFALARFISGTSFDSFYNILFIIVTEYVSPKYITLMNTLGILCFGVASSFFSLIAYTISDWIVLNVVLSFPLIIVFAIPWIVPESIRWYIQSNRIDKAIEMLKKLARVNGKSISDEVLMEFEKSSKTMTDETLRNNHTILDLFKLRRLGRITVLLAINWLLIIFITDAHVYNIKSLNSNVFVPYSLISICELPATIVVYLLLDRLGRRWMCFLFMAICGVFSFLTLWMPFGIWATITASVARTGVSVAIDIANQHITELLPTVVRTQGSSLIHIIGYVGHTLAPSIGYLANIEPSLPLVLLGSLPFISAFVSLTLPETTNEKLPDTIEEGNNLGKEQSFWWVPRTRKD